MLAEEPPSWAGRILEPMPSGIAVTTDGIRVQVEAFLGVSERNAEYAARRIAGTRLQSELPRTVRWADLELPPAPAPGEARSLIAPLGLVHREGALPATWLLNLDESGPHVLIAGTTGSGKSALLETLVLALAERWAPADLQLALFDFKGGAGLASCMGLPHVGGVVTDLDGRGARRALAALGVELARRKAELAAHGHSSFAEWEAVGGAPPRLLVVVDEFQEIGSTHRDFMPDVTRLAAQGRSLGMHLVLATQRPSGAVTPDIRANTGVTIALRVASEADSRDLVGTDAAARIPAHAPGRAIVASGESRLEVHVALPSASRTAPVRIVGAPAAEPESSLVDLIIARHDATTPDADTARRSRVPPLWHAPLPERIRLEELDAAEGIALGLVDRAATRSRATLAWNPSEGPLFVVGSPGSERSRVLSCAAAGAVSARLRAVWLPADAREAARTLALARQADDVLLVVEDVAAAMAALSTVDRGAAAEALIARASMGKALAIGIGPGNPQRVAAHASVRVILAHTSPHDDALWGIPREFQDIPAGPGAARSWDHEGWGEALIAEPMHYEPVVLVHALPARVERNGLHAPRAVGIGGDDARVVIAPPGGVTVVGPPGRERDGVVRLLEAAGVDDVPAFDSPLLMPPRARDGVIVAVAPTPRIAEDVCRGGASGLVDPEPPHGRVLWVESGVGACVQLALG
jgi:S-DNA-T family DNA segregation ATPase FtsK/SpoIIIE